MEYFMLREGEKLTGEQIERRQELRKKVDTLRESFTSRAEILVHETMPEKVAQLDAIITSDIFRITDLSLVESPLGIPLPFESDATKDINTLVLATASGSSAGVKLESGISKKRRLEDDDGAPSVVTTATNGESAAKPAFQALDREPRGFSTTHTALIPSNKLIQRILDMLKKEIEELFNICNCVKMWIQLNIPRVEGGNNLGVGVQVETVDELGKAEESGFALLDSMSKYYQMRAKLVSKVLKYPTIEDYRQSVVEFDQKQYTNLRVCVLDLRNNYAILYDVINKNIENIKKPRSDEHVASLY